MLLPAPYSNPSDLPSLRDARPSNQIHLLLWDTPNPHDLHILTTYNNAQTHHYRDLLLSTLQPDQKFLHLHHHLDREVDRLHHLCQTCTQSMVLLHGFDLLLTYLRLQKDSPLPSFWQILHQNRKLAVPLWIVLPSLLAPPRWDRDRLLYLASD